MSTRDLDFVDFFIDYIGPYVSPNLRLLAEWKERRKQDKRKKMRSRQQPELEEGSSSTRRHSGAQDLVARYKKERGPAVRRRSVRLNGGPTPSESTLELAALHSTCNGRSRVRGLAGSARGTSKRRAPGDGTPAKMTERKAEKRRNDASSESGAADRGASKRRRLNERASSSTNQRGRLRTPSEKTWRKAVKRRRVPSPDDAAPERKLTRKRMLNGEASSSEYQRGRPRTSRKNNNNE
ncbi:hypothetical protein ElyMa_003773800 [Elysia marginata]|uniref:Uncharacterized protein n=1 Tax=Elysia marginata TaxID=1093978 RepID=A0AAV4F9F2_9GAST|nr:hypothetical protein ElyMa_003773800 [Elysia marginata]